MPLYHGIEVFPEQLYHLASTRVVLRQCVEQFDKGHGVPSLCASPAVLRQSGGFVGPEHLASLVPRMAVESCFGVDGALVGFLYLVDGIVVYLLRLLVLQQHIGGESVVWQPHEDTVEPHLVCVYGLVPIHTLVGARLLLQLFHERLQCLEILGLGIFLVHSRHKVTGAYLVQVVVFELVAAYLALCVDHGVGVHLAVLPDFVVAIFKIGVEHGLKFDAHHVAPFGLLGEVKHI